MHVTGIARDPSLNDSPAGACYSGVLNQFCSAWLACAMIVLLTVGHAQSGPLLAISRTDANKITLIGLDPEERELETIPVACKGPFGLAFTPQRDWLYVACWDHSQVALIDIRSHRESKIFQSARLPAWIRLRDGSPEIWVSNEGAGKVTVYRSGTATILSEIPTGVGPSDIVFTERGKKAWVSNETSGNVSLIDAENHRKIRDIPVGKVPQGMALTSKQDRLMVSNFSSNTVSIIDTATAREVAQIPVCQGPVDVAASRQSGSELGYVSCFKGGSVAVIDIDRRQEIQRIPVGDKPFGIAAHPDGSRIYVCAGGSNQLLVIQAGKSSRIIRRMKLDGNPLRITVAP
jgi:YVTN family beta-propeller protein